MEFVGEYLKNIRIQKKFEILDISNELKIGTRVLKYIESDNFHETKNFTYLIGHIRAYSKFLNLDDDRIIENFKNQIFYDPSGVEKKISKPITTSFFSIPKSISIASILTIGLGFYLLFVRSNDLYPNYAMTPNLPENFEADIEAAQMKFILAEKNKKNIEDISSDYDDIIILDKIKKQELGSSLSAIASTSNNLDIQLALDEITLKFLGSTWIQLRDDKNLIIISKLMNKGDQYSYNLSQNLNLTAGNAGNIIIFINNLNKGRAGKHGEVVESLFIDSKFNN